MVKQPKQVISIKR